MSEENDNEEYKFPLVFDSCPNCGCKDTIIRVALKKYVEQGKAKIDENTAIFRFATMLLDPSQALFSLPTLATVLDGCPKCGTAFYTRVDLQDIPVTGQVKPKQGPPTSSFFGKG